MTIQFQGHVAKIECGQGDMFAVTLCPPRSTVKEEWITVQVPANQASAWLPGRVVNFTIYTLPPAGESGA